MLNEINLSKKLCLSGYQVRFLGMNIGGILIKTIVFSATVGPFGVVTLEVVGENPVVGINTPPNV